MWPGDFPHNVPPFLPGFLPPMKGNPTPFWYDIKTLVKTQETNVADMANMGMMYQLTGDEKYGEFCKKMLLAYADGFTHWGHPPGWTPGKYRSATDGRLTGQFLEDGGWLIMAAYAYDMVATLPSWTPAERAHIRDDLFKPITDIFTDPHVGKTDYLDAENNRSAICAAGVLMAGYASEDQGLINLALYGRGGTKDAPTGGLLQAHFGNCLMPDGLWNEGAPAYQLGIASDALFDDAETLWHHGIDMYRFRGGVLKRLLDSAIALAYPDANMTVAALHDSGRMALVGNGGISVPYECGYRRYHDANYLPLIENKNITHSLSGGWGPPSLFLDLPPADSAPPRRIENANFYAVGYGVLRLPTQDGYNQLLLEYGPSGSHGHPSKLGIDVYALGAGIMPMPGSVYPYNDPRDPNWYHTTLSNNVMEVDEQSQYTIGTPPPRGSPFPDSTQLVYGPASTMGIQRAWSGSVYVGVDQDRALFFTPEYLADIYGAFSNAPHKYDLAWHICGDMTTTLKADPFKFPDPVAPGYNTMTNVTHAGTDQPWTATLTTPNKHSVRFLAAGGTPTDVYLGNGLAVIGNVTPPEAGPPPMIIQRRVGQNNVLFGNAVDLSGEKDGYLKSVAQEGSLDAGYGLLKLETVKGSDLCFTSFRPGSYIAGDLQTDAMQATVKMDGANVKAMYLGGGTTLKVTGGSIKRSEPGLAFVEKVANGSYVVGNPSSTPATITVTLAALQGLKAQQLDDAGKPTGPAQVTAGASGSISISLQASSKVEFGAQ
jgi:hypothetical protein